MSQDGRNLNNIAQERFLKLRTKLNLDVQKPIIQKAIELTQEKIDKMTHVNEVVSLFSNKANEAVEASRGVDQAFDFIDKLKLPPQLSLAIGLIISGHKTSNTDDITKAVLALNEYNRANIIGDSNA